jgi:DNA-binding XRE family transcriptional regulator
MNSRKPKVRYLREVWMKVIRPEGIKRARKRAGYTQYDLAALARCTQAAISGLETGNMPRCSEDLAKSICKWLDRDVEDLFERHGASRVDRVTNAAGSTHQRPTPKEPAA